MVCLLKSQGEERGVKSEGDGIGVKWIFFRPCLSVWIPGIRSSQGGIKLSRNGAA